MPDLRSRVPIGQEQSRPLSNYPLGAMAGRETVTLGESELAPHTHAVVALTGPGSANVPWAPGA